MPRTYSKHCPSSSPERGPRALPGHRGPGRKRQRRVAGSVGPDRADVRERVTSLEEARDPHDVTRLRSMDERSISDVHTFVLRDAGGGGIEEDEVAGLQLV